MKYTKTFLIVVVLAVGCVLNYSNAEAQIIKGDKRIQVQTLALPEMPVILSSTTGMRVGKQSVLTYSVTNQTDKPLKSFEVAVFVINSDGQIIGGEGWEITSDLAANSTEEFPFILQSKVEAGDHLVVTVPTAAGQTGRFDIKATELLDAVKFQVVGRKGTFNKKSVFPSVKYTKVSWQQQPPSFCENAETRAGAACTCGIQSFSCNETARTYSWTCAPRTKGCIQG